MRESVLTLDLAGESATSALGARLAEALPADAAGLLLTLGGELGAGKTTLARALLRSLGVVGPVRSPTYTLVEPYATARGAIVHCDLYRLSHPGELDALGYRESRAASVLTLIEWPERGASRLGPVDLDCRLGYSGTGRGARFVARTAAGTRWLAAVRDGLAQDTPAGLTVLPEEETLSR